jgi:hypothetical protein
VYGTDYRFGTFLMRKVYLWLCKISFNC